MGSVVATGRQAVGIGRYRTGGRYVSIGTIGIIGVLSPDPEGFRTVGVGRPRMSSAGAGHADGTGSK